MAIDYVTNVMAPHLSTYEKKVSQIKSNIVDDSVLDVLSHASMVLDQGFLDIFDDYVEGSQIEIEEVLLPLVDSCLDHIKDTQGFFMHASCLLFSTLSDADRQIFDTRFWSQDPVFGISFQSDTALPDGLLSASDEQIEQQIQESTVALRRILSSFQDRKIIPKTPHISQIYIFDPMNQSLCLKTGLYGFLDKSDDIWRSCKLSLLVIISLISGFDVAARLQLAIEN